MATAASTQCGSSIRARLLIVIISATLGQASPEGTLPCALNGVAEVFVDPSGTTLDPFPLPVPLSLGLDLSFLELHDTLRGQFKTVCSEAAALQHASRRFKYRAERTEYPGVHANMSYGSDKHPRLVLIPFLKSARSYAEELELLRELFHVECGAQSLFFASGWTTGDCVAHLLEQVSEHLQEHLSLQGTQVESSWSGEFFWPGFFGEYGASWSEGACANDLLDQVDSWVLRECNRINGDEGDLGALRDKPPPQSPHHFVLSGLEITGVSLDFPWTKYTVEGSHTPWSQDRIRARTSPGSTIPDTVPVPELSLERVHSYQELQRSLRSQFNELCAQNLKLPLDPEWTVGYCTQSLLDQLVGFTSGLSRVLFDPLPPVPPRFFSIGSDCSVPSLLRYLGLRQPSTPFDWTINPISTVHAVLSGEMLNITDNMLSMNHAGGDNHRDPKLFLRLPFSTSSGMLFAHDCVCLHDKGNAGDESSSLSPAEARLAGMPTEVCTKEALFHDKYTRRMSRFIESVAQNSGGITYIVYSLPKTNLLNITVFPQFSLKHQLAAVTKLKDFFRERNDVIIVSLREILPVARRACVEKLKRQRIVSRYFRSHKVASAEDGVINLTDLRDIDDAIQTFADKFCGLTEQPKNWFHPGSNDVAQLGDASF